MVGKEKRQALSKGSRLAGGGAKVQIKLSDAYKHRTVYLAVEDKGLAELLSFILESLDYLPEQLPPPRQPLGPSIKSLVVKPQAGATVFTTYPVIMQEGSQEIFSNFQKVVVIIPFGKSLILTEKLPRMPIYYFSAPLTAENIQVVLKNIEKE